MALKGTLAFALSTNWNNMEDLQNVWVKNKNQLKKPGFLSDLHNFDIRLVTPEQIKIVRSILNDGWMQQEMTTRHLGIAAESNFSL